MSDCFPGHVAINSSRECSSACISQLHRTDLFNKDMWVSLNFDRIFMVVFTYYIFSLGQFASIISFPPSRTDGFTSVL